MRSAPTIDESTFEIVGMDELLTDEAIDALAELLSQLDHEESEDAAIPPRPNESSQQRAESNPHGSPVTG